MENHLPRTNAFYKLSVESLGFIRDPTPVRQHTPDLVLTPICMQLCVIPNVLRYVCCWANVPLQVYYLAMNHKPSLHPAHCVLKVKQTN